MALSPEDALRLNVLLAGSLEAVRIDESSMTLHALSGKGEARVKLNPNCRDESYLRQVRETLSSHVLGSPGGYPVYLKRWTRMGQARDEILESLLLLGEPEAVVAVVNACGITDELARRAWWTSQTAENARCMLSQDAVVAGDMGPVLAEFLVEFLPFEEEARDQIASVRLVLQGELVDAAVRRALWEKGRYKNALHVGFLQAVPDALPELPAASPAWMDISGRLDALVAADNPYAIQFCRLLSPAGQAWVGTVQTVLRKPLNQDVMVELMRSVAAYLEPLPFERKRLLDMQDIMTAADDMLNAVPGELPQLADVLQAVPAAVQQVRAMLVLAMVDEPLLNPVFSRSDAIGTVMRKKLKPVTGPVQEQLDILAAQ